MPRSDPAPALCRPARPWTLLRGWLALLLTLVAAVMPARAAANLSGLWTSPNGDYTVLLQDSASGSTFAIQVPASFDALRVWLGNGTASSVNLQNLLVPTDSLVASISGDSMSGTIQLAGVAQPFDASLALAWVATEFAGVWQKDSAPNAYLVFCVLNAGGTRLAVQIDVTINPDARSYTFDVFTGALATNYGSSQFTGLSLTGSGQTSRLSFAAHAETLAGSTTTPGRPPLTTTYGATHFVKLAP